MLFRREVRGSGPCGPGDEPHRLRPGIPRPALGPRDGQGSASIIGALLPLASAWPHLPRLRRVTDMLAPRRSSVTKQRAQVRKVLDWPAWGSAGSRHTSTCPCLCRRVAGRDVDALGTTPTPQPGQALVLGTCFRSWNSQAGAPCLHSSA